MEDKNIHKSNQDMVLAGICPSNHNSEETVCKACYEELLKKYNNIKGSGKSSKSQWHTW